MYIKLRKQQHHEYQSSVLLHVYSPAVKADIIMTVAFQPTSYMWPGQ